MERRYPLYRALIGFACQAPVFALYFLSQGLDYEGLLRLTVLFGAAKLVCDVPSGIFADRAGRRAAILARTGIEAASVAVLFAAGFPGRFAASSLLAGAACAFSSGAEQALVYETCGPSFARVYGRAASWSFVSGALAALAGGALATAAGYESVYLLRLVSLAGAGAVAWTFPRPARRPAPRPVRAVRPAPDSALTRALAFFGLVGAVQVGALWLQQPYFRELGVPVAGLGALHVAFQFAAAAGARAAHRIGDPRRFVAAASIAGLAGMAAPFGIGSAAAVLLIKFAHGVSLPAAGLALSRNAPAEARATAISLRSLFEGAALALAAPALGWAARTASLSAAYALAALLIVPALFLLEAPCSRSEVSRSPA